MANFVGRIISAFVFLTASPQRLGQADPRQFARLAWPMMLLSIAWGFILMGLWNVAFHFTWPHLLNWMVPSAVCGLAMTFGPYRRGAMALVETAAGGRGWLRWPGVPLLAAGVAAALNHAFGLSDHRWPIYLLLAPVWGAWSMVVLGQFHRPGRRTDPPTRRLAETVKPLTAAICLALPLAGSLVFLNFLHPWRHFVPPAAAIAAALGGGTLIVRLRGGLSRQALLAVNFLTQLAFLAAYLAVRG